jgi:hypothetical protein
MSLAAEFETLKRSPTPVKRGIFGSGIPDPFEDQVQRVTNNTVTTTAGNAGVMYTTCNAGDARSYSGADLTALTTAASGGG